MKPTESMTRHDSRFRSVLLVASLYVVVGIVTAALARSASTVQVRDVWRLVAWLFSLVVFAGHVVYERVRAGNPSKRAAMQAAGAVALAAFVLAVVGPVRSHWDSTDFRRVTVLSVALWPILTGVPAFLVALAGASILGRFVVGDRSGPAKPSTRTDSVQ